jgi:hypothetical protein
MARQHDLNCKTAHGLNVTARTKWNKCVFGYLCNKLTNINCCFENLKGGRVGIAKSNYNGAPARPQPQNRAWAECDRQNEMKNIYCFPNILAVM